MIKDKVSVIVPTCNRHDIVFKNLNNILKQNYSPFEVIVCDDSDKQFSNNKVSDFAKKTPQVKYIYTARFDAAGNKDYGLARARNHGIIEASGEFIVFLDDRITPANLDMLSIFVKHIKSNNDKVWYFGDKGAHKTSFVENCSAIRKSLIVDAGMFCERIDKYGGMSRELIGRFTRQGFKLQYVPEALATQVSKSTGWDTKPQDIEEMKKLLKKLFDR